MIPRRSTTVPLVGRKCSNHNLEVQQGGVESTRCHRWGCHRCWYRLHSLPISLPIRLINSFGRNREDADRSTRQPPCLHEATTYRDKDFRLFVCLHFCYPLRCPGKAIFFCSHCRSNISKFRRPAYHNVFSTVRSCQDLHVRSWFWPLHCQPRS